MYMNGDPKITSQIIENLKSNFLQIIHLFIHRTSISLQTHIP